MEHAQCFRAIPSPDMVEPLAYVHLGSIELPIDSDVVPLQPTNIWDNGLAALQHFGQIHVNIVQKATTFFAQF